MPLRRLLTAAVGDKNNRYLFLPYVRKKNGSQKRAGIFFSMMKSWDRTRCVVVEPSTYWRAFTGVKIIICRSVEGLGGIVLNVCEMDSHFLFKNGWTLTLGTCMMA